MWNRKSSDSQRGEHNCLRMKQRKLTSVKRCEKNKYRLLLAVMEWRAAAIKFEKCLQLLPRNDFLLRGKRHNTEKENRRWHNLKNDSEVITRMFSGHLLFCDRLNTRRS